MSHAYVGVEVLSTRIACCPSTGEADSVVAGTGAVSAGAEPDGTVARRPYNVARDPAIQLPVLSHRCMEVIAAALRHQPAQSVTKVSPAVVPRLKLLRQKACFCQVVRE